ncbi:MAG: hypothetical protein WC910_11360, partial [Bacteroidales bacterium]
DYDTGKAITDWANKGADEYSMGKETSGTLVKKGVLEGVESMPASVAAGLPGAVAGATVGSAFPGLGTWLGGAIGYGLSGGSVMGLAEYQNYLDEYRKATGKEPDASTKGMAGLSALAEGGFEGISGFLEGLTIGAGRGIIRPAATTLKELLKAPLKTWAKRFVKVEGIEVSTEMATAYSQASLRKAQGLPTMEPLEAAKAAIIPALTMGTMFTLGGAGLTRLHRMNMENNLINPDVEPQDRAKAVEYVADLIKNEYGEIGRIDTGTTDEMGNPVYENEIGNLWKKYGEERILAGEPISLDFELDKINLEAQMLEDSVRRSMGLKPDDLGETATPSEEVSKTEGQVTEPTIPQGEDIKTEPPMADASEKIASSPSKSSSPVVDSDEAINAFVSRIAGGEKMTSPEDLQFLTNNTRAINERLVQKAKAEKTPSTLPLTELSEEGMANPPSTPEKTSQEATQEKTTVSDGFKDGKIKTLSGRVLTPPIIRTSSNVVATKDSKKADEWLRKEAIEEAKAKGDEFAGDQFKMANPAKMTQAEREGMHDYLFGETKNIFVLESEKPLKKKAKSATKILKVFPDKENGLEVHVARVAKGFSVAVKDIGSGKFFDEVKIYPTDKKAIEAAKAIIKKPKPEKKPPPTVKQSLTVQKESFPDFKSFVESKGKVLASLSDNERATLTKEYNAIKVKEEEEQAKLKVSGVEDGRRRIAGENGTDRTTDDSRSVGATELSRPSGLQFGRLVDEQVRSISERSERAKWDGIVYSPTFQRTTELSVGTLSKGELLSAKDSQALVTDILSILADGSSINFVGKIDPNRPDIQKALTQWKQGNPDASFVIEGMHRKVIVDGNTMASIIEVSMGSSDIGQTAWHEAWHSIDEIFLTANEKKILAEKLTPNIEKQADIFAKYAANQKHLLPKSAKPIFERIREFFE